MQIGSNINGKNLDDPEFEPVWAVANAHNAFCMVHPNNVAGVDRLKSYYLNNLIGNPLDTTIAAACLVFGGVIERFPNIRFFMVHGGGFTPYQAGRWQHGWHVRPEPKKHLKKPPAETIRTLLLGHHPALASRSSSSWCRSSAPPTSCSAATTPTTWARSNARGRSRRCRCGELDKVTILNGLVQKLLAGVK